MFRLGWTVDAARSTKRPIFRIVQLVTDQLPVGGNVKQTLHREDALDHLDRHLLAGGLPPGFDALDVTVADLLLEGLPVHGPPPAALGLIEHDDGLTETVDAHDPVAAFLCDHVVRAAFEVSHQRVPRPSQ